jgi:hypothetical protein
MDKQTNQDDQVSLSLEDNSAEKIKPVRKSNPDGVLRAAGRFRNNPMLDELIQSMNEIREEEKRSQKAA